MEDPGITWEPGPDQGTLAGFEIVDMDVQALTKWA